MDGTTSDWPACEDESEAYSLFQRGMCFLEEQHPAQAALLLAGALRLEPDKISIREGLAQAEFAFGRHRQAAGHFATIVATTPDNDYAHYCLGRCLLRLGRGDEARMHLRLAGALKPHSALYQRALDEIR
ncbi:MAG TPA: tetratricopeptide repeat protein [Thermoleophilia bacterium]|nr:tetratricopeptide repeat protein [Thermoleophilia bacterium]